MNPWGRHVALLAAFAIAAATGCAKSASDTAAPPVATAVDAAQLFASPSPPTYSLWFDGRFYPSQGHDHFAEGASTAFAYNTDPPTSGPHKNVFSDTFNSATPLPAYLQLNLLEHGNVLLQYNCTCPDVAEALYRVALTYDADWIRPNSSQPLPADVEDAEELGRAVIVAPYPGMQHAIALTAWTRLGTLDSFDEQKVGSFIYLYLHNATNTVP